MSGFIGIHADKRLYEVFILFCYFKNSSREIDSYSVAKESSHGGFQIDFIISGSQITFSGTTRKHFSQKASQGRAAVAYRT